MGRPDKKDLLPRERAVVLATLAAPLVWLTHLGVSYALVPEACEQESKLLLHIVSIVSLVLLGLIFLRLRKEQRANAAAEERNRLVSIVSAAGLVMTVSFALVVLLVEVVNWMIPMCG